MEDEGTNSTRLIVGIVAVVVIAVVGFFVLRGILTRKPLPTSHVSDMTATPTSYGQQPTVSVTPTTTSNPTSGYGGANTTKGGLPLYTNSGTYATGITGTTYYYTFASQSQSGTSSATSQNGQSQSQTLPNEMTQSQSQ